MIRELFMSTFTQQLIQTNSIPINHNLESGSITSNSLTSPGLEVVLHEGIEPCHIAKARDSTKKEVCSPSVTKDDKEVAPQASERNKIKLWFFFTIGIIACLIMGLAIGLPVGLTRRRY